MGTESQDDFHPTGFQKWRQVFPWLHLLRVPGIAFHWSILLVGFICSYILMTIDVLTIGQSGHLRVPDIAELVSLPDQLLYEAAAPNASLYLLGSILAGLNHSSYQLNLVFSSLVHVLTGLVICRLAGSLFTTSQGMCLENTVLLAARKIPTFLLGMLFPLIAILILSGLAYLGLATTAIPVAGPWIAGVCYGASLLLIVIMLVFVFGLLIGWPVLVAALMVENEDGFNAWSRSFDYVRSRLLPIVLAAVVCLIFGVVLQALFGQIVELSWRWLDTLTAKLEGIPLREVVDRDHATFSDGPAGFQNLWKTLSSCMVTGFLRGYYWVTVTAIYVLLRWSVDRTPVTEFRRS